MSEEFLSVNLIGDRALVRNLNQMPEVVKELLQVKIEEWTKRLEQAVHDNISSRLRSKSGRLLNAIRSEVLIEGEKIDGRVYMADVPYAGIQDKGGTTRPHFIFPSNGKVLAFFAASGQKVFATRVSHPGSRVEGVHYMKDAYREMGPEISRGIKNSVIKGVRASMRSGL